MFARLIVAAGLAGAVTAPIALADHVVHVDLSLRSADTALSGSDTAIIVGGTGIPTPSVSFAQSAENLYLHPLGFDGGATDSAVCDMSGADPCGAALQVLTTPETTDWDSSMTTGAADITSAVEAEFATGEFSAEHPLTVFAYSQGATDAGMAMTQLAHDGIPSDAVQFVFIGDPSDNGGILNNLVPDLDASVGPTITNWLLSEFNVADVVAGNPGVPTPDDLYPTTEYMLDGDGFANFQSDDNAGGLTDALDGMFYQHREYLGLTPAQIADSTTVTHDDITKFDISDAINNQQAFADAGEMSTDTQIVENGLVSLLNDAVDLVHMF